MLITGPHSKQDIANNTKSDKVSSKMHLPLMLKTGFCDVRYHHACSTRFCRTGQVSYLAKTLIK